MRRLLAVGMASAWLGGPAFPLPARDGPAETPFQPAEAISVSGISDQPLSFANGAVVLDGLVSDKGEVKDIEVRRASTTSCASS